MFDESDVIGVATVAGLIQMHAKANRCFLSISIDYYKVSDTIFYPLEDYCFGRLITNIDYKKASK